jgi:hypothetical protein
MWRLPIAGLVFAGCITFDSISAKVDAPPPPPPQEVELEELPVTMQMAVGTLGAACTAANQCGSGFCVDGFCCDSGCTGQCQACNVSGSVGACTAVSGVPRGDRTPCAGNGTVCEGTCDGTNPSACTYPSGPAQCGAFCDGQCDGQGSCTGVGACAIGYACEDNVCQTSCDEPSDCAPNFECNGSQQCVRIAESDCLDNADNNGDGLIDCADPTCNPYVECAPTAAGSTIGYLSTSTCEADFAQATAVHQGLTQDPTCSGCGCHVRTTCTYRVNRYTSNDTCSSTGLPTLDPRYIQVEVKSDAGADYCDGGASHGAMSHRLLLGTGSNGVDAPAHECIPDGAATPDVPTWASSQTFCGATASSPSCGAGAVCVAKRVAGVCRATNGTAACGGDFPVDQGVHYTGFTAPQCDGCPSTCTKTGDGACSNAPNVYAASVSCNFAGVCTCGADSFTIGAPYTAGVCNTNDLSAFSGVRFNGAISATGTCSISQAAKSSPAAATGARRICCR